MKKNSHPIDDFFREALSEHTITPSSAAKAAFLKETETSIQKKPRNGKRIIYLSLILLLSISGVLLYFVNNSEDKMIFEVEKTVPTLISPGPAAILQQESTTLAEQKTNPTLENEKPKKLLSTNEIQRTENVQEAALIIVEKESPVNVMGEGSSKIENQTNDSLQTAFNENPELPYIKPDSILPEPTIIPEKTSKKEFHDREWRLSTGLYYAPEWMFNTMEGTKPVTNFGIEGTFLFGRYSVRTGVGLSVSKGTNQLAIEYKDYLGSYLRLDSMTFAWDKEHYYLIPTYFLTNQDVFDSLMKLDNAKIIKRYTYLQVPLILGYDFYRTEKFSIGVRLGPVLSVLMSSKTISNPYEPGKKQILSINNITPEQLNLNWQILAGFNATYRFGKRFGIELEPFGKYYFNSVYEYSGGTKPWSIGIRGAVFINF